MSGDNLPANLSFTTTNLVSNEIYDINVYLIETNTNAQFNTPSGTMIHHIDNNNKHVFTTDTTQTNISTYTITTLPPEIISIQTELVSKSTSELVIKSLNFVSNYTSDVYSIEYFSPNSATVSSSVSNGNLANTNTTFTSLFADTGFMIAFTITNLSKPLLSAISILSLYDHYLIDNVNTYTNDSTISKTEYTERTLQVYAPSFSYTENTSTHVTTHDSISIDISGFSTPSDYSTETYILKVECHDNTYDNPNSLIATQSTSSFVGDAFIPSTITFASLDPELGYIFKAIVKNSVRSDVVLIPNLIVLTTTAPAYNPTFIYTENTSTHDSISIDISAFSTASDYLNDTYILKVECYDNNSFIDAQSTSPFVGNGFTSSTLNFTALNPGVDYVFTAIVQNSQTDVVLSPDLTVSTTTPAYNPSITATISSQSFSDSYAFRITTGAITHSHTYYASDTYQIKHEINLNGDPTVLYTSPIESFTNPLAYDIESPTQLTLTQGSTYDIITSLINTTHTLITTFTQSYTIPYLYNPSFTATQNTVTATSISIDCSNFQSIGYNENAYTLKLLIVPSTNSGVSELALTHPKKRHVWTSCGVHTFLTPM